MANGKIRFGKQSGGQLTLVIPDGVTSTDLVLPESGTVASVSGAVTDNAIVRFDGETGKVQTSNITIDDSGNIGSGTKTFNGFGGTGFKNYIINGNFDVWQYGTSQTTSVYGSADRWVNAHNGSTKTTSMQITNKTEPFNAVKFCRTTVSSVAGAGNYCCMQQRVECVNTLSGKNATLSFWAKADDTKNISIDFVQYFGSGGTPSTIIEGISATKVQITSSWVKYTITASVPSIAGKTSGTNSNDSFWVRFWFDAGSDYNSRTSSLGQQSGTFDIAQVQLEEGSVATPFEQRPYALELLLCKRYARDIGNSSIYGQIGNGFAISTTSALIEINVNDMRIVPTIYNTLTANLFEIEYANGAGTSRATCTAIAINSSATANNNKLNLIITVGGGLTTGQCVGFRNNNTSTNKIILSAEL